MKIRLIDCCCCCFADKLHERQRDPDERVRQEVVATICDAAVEQIEHIDDKVLQVLSVQVHCTAPGCVLNVLAGLLPASRWWPDILRGQRNFSLAKSRFWLVKILGKKLTYPFVIFTLWTQLCFFSKKQNLRFTGEDLAVFFLNESAYVTSQHVQWWLKFLARQVAILARYCPLTGCYFEPCI